MTNGTFNGPPMPPPLPNRASASPPVPAPHPAPVAASKAPLIERTSSEGRTMHEPIGRLQGACKVQFDDDLYRCTAWVGANGTGKTARQDAIQLALEHKRIKGKIDALIPPGHTSVWARIELDKQLFGFNSANKDDPAGEHPDARGPNERPVIVRSAAWLLALGASRAREEVAARWGSESTDSLTAPPKTITTEQVALWNTGVLDVRNAIEAARQQAARRGGSVEDIAADPATILGDLQSWARKAKLAVGRSIAQVEVEINNAIEAAHASAAGPVGTDDVATFEEMLKTAEAWERAQPLRARAEQVNADVAAYTAAVEAFNALEPLPDPTQVEKTIKALQAYRESLTATRAVHSHVARLIAESSTNCPCCQKPYDQGEAAGLWETNRPSDSNIQEVAESLRPWLAWFDGYNKTKADRAREADRLAREAARITTTGAELSRALEMCPSSYDGLPSVDLRAVLGAMRTAIERSAAIEASVQRKASYEQQQGNLKAVETAAGSALVVYIKALSETITVEVNKRIAEPLRGRFWFDASACKFMMIGTDGAAHEAHDSGGAEATALTLALARAWAHDQPHILLLEYERDLAAFDRSKLAYVLDDFATAAATDPNLVMVGIASPQELPFGEAWHIIHTSEQTLDLHDSLNHRVRSDRMATRHEDLNQALEASCYDIESNPKVYDSYLKPGDVDAEEPEAPTVQELHTSRMSAILERMAAAKEAEANAPAPKVDLPKAKSTKRGPRSKKK